MQLKGQLLGINELHAGIDVLKKETGEYADIIEDLETLNHILVVKESKSNQ